MRHALNLFALLSGLILGAVGVREAIAGFGGGGGSGGGSGTVTSVSVASANGMAGTVATATTTPAITLKTSVNAPILSGDGTAIAAASTTGTGSTAVLATSPVLVTPALGTPSALVATNATGTASGLTAGTVTTNANLTGPIASTGNATSVTAQTGTGTTFVMQASPTLTTPALGTPSSGVATNLTGTAAGLTAGSVTTNANLTGPVTSVGNATTIANSIALPGSPTTTTQAASDNSTKVATTAYVDRVAFGGTQITASLSGNVAANVSANYFDGPAVAQGVTGTWFASGTVTLVSSAQDRWYCKLWDGGSKIAASAVTVAGASFETSVSLSGIVSAPAGNLRISCRDVTGTGGTIIFNTSGNSLDSTITATRLQ